MTSAPSGVDLKVRVAQDDRNLKQRMRIRIFAIYILLLTAIIPSFSQASARTLIRSWLVAMPDSVISLLTKNNRLDFIDFYDAKMEAVVTNRMEGKSRMDVLTDDFLRINYTRTTDVEMKLLPLNDTTDILCMVTTVKASANDSRIAFFDAQWQPLDATSYIHEPSLGDFRSTQQGDSASWAWGKLDVFFHTYHLSAEETELKCVLTTTDYLSEEDRQAVKPYVRQEPITYRWNDGKFVRNEQ